MTLRSLPEIHNHMLNAAAAYNRIREQYQWAVNYALSPSVGDSNGSKGQLAYSNPVLGTVADDRKKTVRELLDDFADEVERADTRLTAIRVRLDKVLGPEDPKKPRVHPPRSVGKTELQELHKARERRVIRSEHYGN